MYVWGFRLAVFQSLPHPIFVAMAHAVFVRVFSLWDKQAGLRD